MTELIDHLYETLNQLELRADGQLGEIRFETLGKLREIYFRAKARGDDRISAQALRVYYRLMFGAQGEQAGEADAGATELAVHVQDVVFETLMQAGWLDDQPDDAITELAERLEVALERDFRERLIFEP